MNDAHLNDVCFKTLEYKLNEYGHAIRKFLQKYNYENSDFVSALNFME